MSSNPFRKKALGAIDTSRSGSPRSSLRAETPPGDKKNKPIKKVRVLSPPPLSPDSPEWTFDVPQPPEPLSSDNYNYANYYPSFDPFNGASTDESDRDSTATPPPPLPPPPPQQHQFHQQLQQDGGLAGVPPNPFSKTLQDIEGSKDLQKERRAEGDVLKAANEGRKSLNVDSFKRLLMTGNAGDDVSSVSTDRESEASKTKTFPAATTDARENINHRYTGSSADSSDSQDEDDVDGHKKPASQPSGKDKRVPPPPPPSSRHGKSLKQQELKGAEAGKDHADTQGPTVPSRRSMDREEPLSEDVEEPSKVPRVPAEAEPRVDSTPSSPSARKAAPVPPPPRGHGRTDSRSYDNEASRRTSSEARTSSEEAHAPSSSDGTRSTGPAPAPPPPRRPFSSHKQPTVTSSPSISSPNIVQAPSTAQADPDAAQSSSHNSPPPNKPSTAPPPPPPARQPSVRRPPSVTSVDAPSRRVSSENKSRDGVPPPPPRRNRGNSPSANGGKASGEAALPADPGKSADILADLSALQREVDALRGQFR